MSNTNHDFLVKNGLVVGQAITSTGTLTQAGQTFPASDGSAGQYLKTNGSGALSWGTVSTSFNITDGTTTDTVGLTETVTFTGGTNISLAVTDNTVTITNDVVDSDDITEGSSNLFYTDARAIAAIQGASNLTIDGGTLYVDTAADRVGISDTSPQQKLDVAGNIGVNGSEVIDASGNIVGSVADSAMTIGGSLAGVLSNLKVQYGTSYSGTPIQGSFFFDSLNQKLKVYTGSAFIDAVPAGSGGGGGGGATDANTTFRNYSYTLTGTTSAVSGVDDNELTAGAFIIGHKYTITSVGNTDFTAIGASGNTVGVVFTATGVGSGTGQAKQTLFYDTTSSTTRVVAYVNGIKQVYGSGRDFVATTGTSVAFTYNLGSGDTVDIQVYELLTNDAYYIKSEVYTQAEVNSQISTGVSSYLPLAGGTLTGNIDVTGSGVPNITLTSSSGPYSYIESNTVGSLGFAADEGNTGSATNINFRVDGNEIARLTGGSFVVNDGSRDIDFRVESDNNTHMIFVDAGSNEVGIGTSDPRSPLHVLTSHSSTDVTAANTNSTLSIGNNAVGNGIYNAIKFAAHQQDMYIMSFNNAQVADRRLGFFLGSSAGDAVSDERLSIRGNGSVGIGTSSPSRLLHIASNSSYNVDPYLLIDGTNANRDSGIIINAGGGEKKVVRGDLGGNLYFGNSNQIGVYNSGNVTVNPSGSATDFTVESDTNPRAFWVDGGATAGGDVLFGVSSRSGIYNGTGLNGIAIESLGDQGTTMVIQNSTNAGIYVTKASGFTHSHAIQFAVAGAQKGSIALSTSGTTYNTTSDRRLKDNIEPIADATDKLMDMKPVTHTWIADPEAPQVHGFIAQEMQEVIPEAVSGDAESDEMMSMDYGRITPVIVAALQDALKEIKELKTRIDELESK